ncbi:MAG: NAD(+)/NADH kinase [Pirellulaceae bacterium]
MSDESRIPAWAVTPARRPRAVVLDRRAGEDPLDGDLMETIASQLDVVEQGAELQQPEMLDEVDLLVVLGGDGSILRAAQQMGTRQRPVIGINLGRLGFLAAISPGEVESALASIVSGDCVITSHLMLKCSLIRDGKVQSEQLGLNEAAIRVGNPFSLLDIDLYVDSKLATTYSCDGLIISTPVGSTAHSLSAGGPILRKTMQAFVIAAISPHTLTVRPVVDSAERVFEMRVRTADVVASLVVDGQQLACLAPDDRVRIERASESFQLIEVADHDDYQTLREKLDWGGRIRHKK